MKLTELQLISEHRVLATDFVHIANIVEIDTHQGLIEDMFKHFWLMDY